MPKGVYERPKHYSEEHRKAISNGLRGRKLSNECKANISMAFKDKPKSQEHRQKISDGLRGYTQTESHRRNLSKANKGKPTSIELKVMDQLFLNQIKHEFQKPICNGDFVIDFYLPDYRLVIECNGDYWHNLPHRIERDKRLEQYILSKQRQILWLWEHEINSELFNIATLLRRYT